MTTADDKAVRQLDTEKLLKLVERSAKLSDALEAHPEEFSVNSFSDELKALLAARGMSPAALEQRSLLSRTFTYQLLRGERAPGRDIVLRLAIAIRCSVDETQRLLRLARRGALYPRVERDAAILYALHNRMDLTDTDALLASLGQTTLV